MSRIFVKGIVAGVLTTAFLAVAPAARAEVPVFGVGVGIGEVGTIGLNARLRPFNHFQIEAGIGGYVYLISNGHDTDSGIVPAYSTEALFMLSDRQSRNQHGIGLLLGYEEIRGTLVGLCYRYERYFKDKRSGFHAELGVLYGPDAEENAIEYFDKNSDIPIDDDDYSFIPVTLKIGFHF